MSPAPTVAANESQPDDVAAYKKAVRRQNELILDGMSMSGHERNCCFLNSGSGRFANVSAAIGLDHIGDGRGYALADWDHDGDVDIWATNRTGPRAQFFRNNGAPGNHYLALKLRGNGTTVNRDAIGARVEIVLNGSDEGKRIKTVKAGEGYVSQSAKTLIFGLGPNKDINRLIVDWPGGEKEEFTDFEADSHYLIVQGSGRPRPWIRIGEANLAVVSRENLEEETPEARIQLHFRIPMPTFDYESLDRTLRTVDLRGSGPTLVTLWASWCYPCLKELADFKQHEQELRSSGVQILALSVDQLSEDEMSDTKAATTFLEKQQFPFDVGFATGGFMEMLDAVHHFLYRSQRQTTVPTSFLFDSQGRMAVIYRGRIDVGELLADVDQLAFGDLPWFESALPYEGTWLNRPPEPDLGSLVDAFVNRGLAEEARQYFDRFGEVLARNPQLPNLLLQLGASFGDEGDLVEAGKRFQQAIAADSQNGNAHLQLGKVYLMQRNFDKASLHALRAAELQPDLEEAHFILATLYDHKEDSGGAIQHLKEMVRLNPESAKSRMLLGGVYAKTEQWSQAIEQFQQAVRIAPDAAETHYQLALVLEKSGRMDDAAELFQQAGKLDPDNAKRQFKLGVGLADVEDIDGAIRHFRLANRLDPKSPFIMNALAWMIATREAAEPNDIAEALRLALVVAKETNFEHPRMLDTLAAAYAASGEFDKAVTTAQKAIEIAEADNETDLAGEIRGRLKYYERQKPYRLLPSNSKQE